MYERNEMLKIVIKGMPATYKTTIAELIKRRLKSVGVDDIVCTDPDNFPVSDAEFTEFINKVNKTKAMSFLTVYSLFNDTTTHACDKGEVRIEYSSDTLMAYEVAPLMINVSKELENLGASCYFNNLQVLDENPDDIYIPGDVDIGVVHEKIQFKLI